MGTPQVPDFQDGKDPGALRTIGEVGAVLGIKAHVLRYWEEQFPMLRPLTRAGGRRYYRPEDVALLVEIDRLLHREGYTIRGARQALKDGGKGVAHTVPDAAERPVLQAAEPLDAGLPEDQIVAALTVLRAHLESIRDHLAGALGEA